ncbi:MAG TPA: NUDIX domain-containing protein [Nevskiaceae bacterium]|nr:NUDIX domain-containing protein [Nevskiaceae bacterium]
MTPSFPVSIKGVLFDAQACCVLALNDRDEWELPGGRLEIGETPEQCLVREFEEELGVRIAVRRLLDTWLFEVIPGRHVFIVTYGCAAVDGAFAPVASPEHRRVDSFPMAGLPQNLPAGYRHSIEAWHAAR